MSDREELHKLIDKLPEEEIPRLRSILEAACEPETEGPSVFDELDKIVEELHKDIPDEAWDTVPDDLSYNHDHYLYGAPKKKIPKKKQ
jgi:hypothetical protein